MPSRPSAPGASAPCPTGHAGSRARPGARTRDPRRARRAMAGGALRGAAHVARWSRGGLGGPARDDQAAPGAARLGLAEGAISACLQPTASRQTRTSASSTPVIPSRAERGARAPCAMSGITRAAARARGHASGPRVVSSRDLLLRDARPRHASSAADGDDSDARRRAPETHRGPAAQGPRRGCPRHVPRQARGHRRLRLATHPARPTTRGRAGPARGNHRPAPLGRVGGWAGSH